MIVVDTNIICSLLHDRRRNTEAGFESAQKRRFLVLAAALAQ